MKRIEWDNVSTQTYGTSQALEPGAYVCTIIKMEEQFSKTGKAGVQIFFDIAEGPFADYYRKQFDRDRSYDDRKWRGTYWQMVEGKGLSHFKGFITALEESNPRFKWDWDETKVKGLKCGIVFGREQYKNLDGELKWSVKPRGFCSTAKVGEIEPPKDRLLQEDQSQSRGFEVQSVPMEFQTPPPVAPQYEPLADGDADLPF